MSLKKRVNSFQVFSSTMAVKKNSKEASPLSTDIEPANFNAGNGYGRRIEAVGLTKHTTCSVSIAVGSLRISCTLSRSEVSPKRTQIPFMGRSWRSTQIQCIRLCQLLDATSTLGGRTGVARVSSGFFLAFFGRGCSNCKPPSSSVVRLRPPQLHAFSKVEKVTYHFGQTAGASSCLLVPHH